MAKSKPKSAQEIEREADERRKKAADAANKKAVKDAENAEKKLMDSPLKPEERDYVRSIKARLGTGRQRDMPRPDEMLKYSKLVKRIDIPAEEPKEGDE